jgi:hypothetical protein
MIRKPIRDDYALASNDFSRRPTAAPAVEGALSE